MESQKIRYNTTMKVKKTKNTKAKTKTKGKKSEEPVVKVIGWFQALCRTVGNEQGIDVTGAGYVQINRREDGKTEVS